MARPVILTVDEGTTGTRAALIDGEGGVHHLVYERLHVSSPRTGVVEQDPMEILEKTKDVMRRAIAAGDEDGLEVVGVAIAVQRGTASLWDRETGRPFVPSLVWQDTRNADILLPYAERWDEALVPIAGRPVGVRNPYLWAAQQLAEHEDIRRAHEAGRLLFGTVDTWLVWNLTGGASIMSATNATSCGSLDLQAFEYFYPYIDDLGFPRDLLPELIDDVVEPGKLTVKLDGRSYPLLAVVGDQHGALVGLSVVEPGKSMCVHGTGSFVDLLVGEHFPAHPALYEGSLTLTGWRSHGVSTFTVETFTAATGAAFDWVCEHLGWFGSAREISARAEKATDAGGVTFIPALTGIRSPVMNPHVTASLNGITMATTKEQVSYALLEGVAQFVAQSVAANAETAGIEPAEVVVGGGMSRSDPLIQIQADLVGCPMRRFPHADHATLTGAAFLGGSQHVLWDSLDAAVSTLDSGTVFEPSISADEREARRDAWLSRIDHEIAMTKEYR